MDAKEVPVNARIKFKSQMILNRTTGKYEKDTQEYRFGRVTVRDLRKKQPFWVHCPETNLTYRLGAHDVIEIVR